MTVQRVAAVGLAIGLGDQLALWVYHVQRNEDWRWDAFAAAVLAHGLWRYQKAAASG